jgi:NADH:ubiquinone oxidoreductase subunit E
MDALVFPSNILSNSILKALAEGKKQDAIMQKVMKIQNIEKLWNSEEVNNFILNSLK